MSMKNTNGTVGNRTRDLPACSAVPQPTAPPRASSLLSCIMLILHCPNVLGHFVSLLKISELCMGRVLLCLCGFKSLLIY